MPDHLLFPVSAKRRVLASLQDRIIGLDYHAKQATANMACFASRDRMPIAQAMQGPWLLRVIGWRAAMQTFAAE